MNHSFHSTDISQLVDDHAGDPANDYSCGPKYIFADVELLVATTVARVTARVQPEFINVMLDLSADGAVVAADPISLAFALAGVLGAVLRAADDNGVDENLHIVVTEADRVVRISIAGLDVPPLRMLRALSDDPAQSLADPTVVHCRHLIELQGGTLGLGACGGELAVEVCLPALPRSGRLRVVAPRSLRAVAPNKPTARVLAC